MAIDSGYGGYTAPMMDVVFAPWTQHDTDLASGLPSMMNGFLGLPGGPPNLGEAWAAWPMNLGEVPHWEPKSAEQIAADKAAEDRRAQEREQERYMRQIREIMAGDDDMEEDPAARGSDEPAPGPPRDPFSTPPQSPRNLDTPHRTPATPATPSKL
jgi:hypothetical protein